MGLLNRIASFCDDWHWLTAGSVVAETPTINPAKELAITDGIDIAGNPSGTDLSRHHHGYWQHHSHGSGLACHDHHTTWHEPFPTGIGGGHDSWHD
jgi:hypothetical protein